MITTPGICKDEASTVFAFSKRMISVMLSLLFHRNNERVLDMLELRFLKMSSRVNALIFIFLHLLEMFLVTNYIAGSFEHHFTAALFVVAPSLPAQGTTMYSFFAVGEL
jgi:hypothetical protein